MDCGQGVRSIRRAKQTAGRVRSKRASGSNVPPRRDPGCTGCRIRAWWRARRCEWSWCRRWHWRCRGGASRWCASRYDPTWRHPAQARGWGKGSSASVGLGRECHLLPTCAPRRRDDAMAALDVRVQRESRRHENVAEGEVARRDADRFGGWGDLGETHQASALGLLAEVVEQRGHVAEALGGILPVKKERGLSVSDLPSSASRIPRLPDANEKPRALSIGIRLGRWDAEGDATRT